MDEDFYFVRLKCIECDNDECKICPLGSYISSDSEQGCTRKVSEEDYAKYQHYMLEVLPTMRLLPLDAGKRVYKEIIDFLFHIYSCPLGAKIGKSGRALVN